MGLKNKQERQDYFYESKNWNMIDEMCNEIIVAHKLENYPIARISWVLDFKQHETSYIKSIISHYHILGYFEINPNCTLKSVYSMSVNQCIDLMTKCDKEGK